MGSRERGVGSSEWQQAVCSKQMADLVGKKDKTPTSDEYVLRSS